MATLNRLIGNTPMIKISYKFNNTINYIYTKLEFYNITGSIKDRVALYMLQDAKANGILSEKMTIYEATSGNTGISLAALGRYYNHPVHIYMPEWVSKERLQLMKLYGANVFLVSKEEGGFIKCINLARREAQKENGFFANQFSNISNYMSHYETTGAEILKQIPENIGGFVSGVGTGGTLMGVGALPKEKDNNTVIAAVEPDKMPIISGGEITGQHKIEGIGDEFVPDLVNIEKIDEVMIINDEDAINMSRKISKELGIGVGISSGANLLGSILLANKIENAVVTIFPDDNKKYLSTDLSKDIDPNEKFISNKIELIQYEIV